MAIIKCPKCGQSISDKAEKCVHCGAVIGEKSFAKATIQDNPIIADEKLSDNNAKPKDTTNYADKFLHDNPLIDRFLKKSAKAESVHKKFRTGFWLVWEVPLLLLAWLFNKDGESFIGISVPIMLFLLALAVIMVLNAWFQYYPSYKYITACARWIKERGYDVSDYISREYSSYLKIGDGDALNEMFDFTSAWYYSRHEQDMKNMRLHLIIRAVIGGAALAWLVFAMPFIAVGVWILDVSMSLLVVSVIILVLLISVYIVTFFTLTMRDYKLVRSVYDNEN